MALVDDIRALRLCSLKDLRDAHDYYADTKIAWGIVREAIVAGHAFSTQNQVTSTVTTQADLLAKVQGYVTGHLAEATIQQFLAIFENFFFNLLRLWLLAYPQSLQGKQVDFKVVLDALDKDSIIGFMVNKELNEVLYKRPGEWFAYLDSKVKLACPTRYEIDRLAEAKASRDVLTHNQGIVNKNYLAKAASLARFREGERLDIPEPYHRQTWELLCKLVADLSDAAMAKAV